MSAAELSELLAGAGIATAASDAQALWSHAGGDAGRARALAERRAGGAPLGLLLGEQDFLGVKLRTDAEVLVPREETEILGRAAQSILREHAPRGLLVDMCCGSGNLVCGLAATVPGIRAWASDLTAPAVALAQKNVEALGLGERVRVVQGDLFAPLAGNGLEAQVDVVVCNPPYISTGKLAKERATLLEHEPREAFDGGPYGLSLHQRVLRDALAFLKPGGFLLFEMGLGQERQLEILFKRAQAYQAPIFHNDAAGAPRVAVARRKTP